MKYHFDIVVRIPSLLKENKVSSGAEDNTKSAEVGTHKAGHWSNLASENFDKQSVILCSGWCNIMHSLV